MTSSMRHVLGIIAAIACLILCTILPYLPGEYDALALPVSMMAQASGFVGLLLVPVGVSWGVAEMRGISARKRYGFALAALVVAALAWILVSLAALISSRILALIAISVGIPVWAGILRRVRASRERAPERASVIPAYLVVIPLAVLLVQRGIAEPVTDWSRSRTIRNSATLIGAIEAYRQANGRYPQSLIALHRDYKPESIGVERYHYKPDGDSYNVLFEQPSFRLGTREIVMYNPRDQQTMTSHTIDILELSPAQLVIEHTRGHNEVHAAREPHWKYFWFD